MDFDFCLYVLYASVGCSIAFQDEKRADSENKAGLCEKCQIFWKKLFSALVEKALPEMKNGMIMLSRQEKVLETDAILSLRQIVCTLVWPRGNTDYPLVQTPESLPGAIPSVR